MTQVNKSNHNRGATTTDNKLNTIAESVAHINSYVGRRKLKGLALLLPGGYFQIPRHVAEFELKGIPEHNQVHGEWTPAVHESHVRFKQREGLLIELSPGCIFNTLDNVLEAGLHVSIFEKDGTTAMSEEDEKAIKKCASNGVEILEFTYIVKTKLTPYLAKWKSILGLRRYKNRTSKSGLANPIREITIGANQAIADKLGYDAKFIPYAGKGGCHMLTVIFTKKR